MGDPREVSRCRLPESDTFPLDPERLFFDSRARDGSTDPKRWFRIDDLKSSIAAGDVLKLFGPETEGLVIEVWDGLDGTSKPVASSPTLLLFG